MEIRIFGQVINGIGNVADFRHNRVRLLGSGPYTPTQFFWDNFPQGWTHSDVKLSDHSRLCGIITRIFSRLY